jgi:lipopolysaccharide transport system permease protein
MASNQPTKIASGAPLSFAEYVREVVQYRQLIWVFALQEIKTQYVQTRLNLLWVVVRPLMVLALFTFIFDKLIKIPGLLYPYPLFAFIGLWVWNNFSYLVNNGGNVILGNQNLIRKMYFPRLILLFSKLVVSLIELSVSLVLTLLLMAALGSPVSTRILFVPAFVSISVLVGLTIAIWLNVLNIKYRDLHQFVPTLIGFMIWLTPVFYPVTLIPKAYSFILYLNPISAAIQGCRWAILGDTLPSVYYLPAILGCGVVFVAGLLIFIRSEGDLVDYI